jgi:uncharacterized membrane protein YhaH (DUF805 family)
MIAAAVDAGALLKMLYSSVLAGLSVSIVISLAIYGLTRSSDMRRLHRGGAATAYAVLALVAVALTTALVIYALLLVARK